jgi:hypothetical protein
MSATKTKGFLQILPKQNFGPVKGEIILDDGSNT